LYDDVIHKLIEFLLIFFFVFFRPWYHFMINIWNQCFHFLLSWEMQEV